MCTPSGWLTTNQMAVILEVPRKDLLRMRDDGTLKLGRHYAAFKGKTYSRESYLWNRRAVQKTINKQKRVLVPLMS
jgi:hypothetical protein